MRSFAVTLCSITATESRTLYAMYMRIKVMAANFRFVLRRRSTKVLHDMVMVVASVAGKLSFAWFPASHP